MSTTPNTMRATQSAKEKEEQNSTAGLHIGAIIGFSVGGAVLLLVFIIILWMYIRGKKSRRRSMSVIPSENRRFSGSLTSYEY